MSAIKRGAQKQPGIASVPSPGAPPSLPSLPPPFSPAHLPRRDLTADPSELIPKSYRRQIREEEVGGRGEEGGGALNRKRHAEVSREIEFGRNRNWSMCVCVAVYLSGHPFPQVAHSPTAVHTVADQGLGQDKTLRSMGSRPNKKSPKKKNPKPFFLIDKRE